MLLECNHCHLVLMGRKALGKVCTRCFKGKFKRRYLSDNHYESYLDLIPNDKYYCEICLTRDDLSAHHIIPKRHGGTDEVDNLMCLCRKHHDIVDNHSQVSWDERILVKQIYHILLDMRTYTRIKNHKLFELRTKLKGGKI